MKKRKKPVETGLRLCVSEGDKKRGAGEEVARIGKEIFFDPEILSTYRYDGWLPVHYDLLVVAAAVEYADRCKARRLTKWSRTFELSIPVSDYRNWSKIRVRESLEDALRQLTGDAWHFTFEQGAGGATQARQALLPFPKDQVKYTIAYSNGLDSRSVSGLYPVSEIVRVRVDGRKNRVCKNEKPFDLIPFHVKPSKSPENSVRSRGFKFAAITAIASHLSGVDRVIVPESGQGALGPVLVPLHNIYPDYRNHPVFFRKMERFIEKLLGSSIAFQQPRLWHTKGETIAEYLRVGDGASVEGLLDTRSCWQQRWNARINGKLGQCGLCAACMLRRMSLHAAGVTEPSEKYGFNDLSIATFKDAKPRSNRARPSKSMLEYGIAGVQHLEQLARMAEWPDPSLTVAAFEIAQSTGLSEAETLERLRDLLKRHAAEWRSFLDAQGKKSFIKGWI
ncbi:MAG: 7-cyano-7-deazaguanine synthase [Alphaproteobacteria bacterium]